MNQEDIFREYNKLKDRPLPIWVKVALFNEILPKYVHAVIMSNEHQFEKSKQSFKLI
ncbi:MAG: hypothetical protein ACFFA4_11935 [Promethearchaeota archaeon]